MNFFLFFFNFINLSIWLLIKLLPTKFILELIKLSKIKFIKLNLKRKLRYKRFIKKISYKGLFNDKYGTCLSWAITARLFFNFIGIDNNLKLGIIINNKGEKVPHAWLEDENTGEELTIKSGSNEIFIFRINL